MSNRAREKSKKSSDRKPKCEPSTTTDLVCSDSSSSSSEEFVCGIKGYQKLFFKEVYQTLKVAVLAGNAPFTSLVGAAWQGFDIDLLQAVISRIPCIKSVAVTAFAAETGTDPTVDAFAALRQGNFDLYANSNSLITSLNLQDQLGALATNLAGTPATTVNLYYVPLAGSIVTTAIAQCSTISLDLEAFLSCLVANGAGTGVGMGPGSIQNALLAAAGFDVLLPNNLVPLSATQSAAALANYIATVIQPGVAPLPISSLVFLTSVAGTGFTQAELTAAALAAGLTGLAQVTLTVPPELIGLAKGWYYPKYDGRLALWLSASFDDVVREGVYAKLVQRWFPTAIAGIPTPVAPPQLYSLTQGFVPRSAVYNYLLPDLKCIEPHKVKFLNVPLV